MNVNYNSEEILVLLDEIKKYIPIVKNAAINDLDILTENYKMKKVIQNNGSFQSALILPQYSDHNSNIVLGVGYPRTVNTNVIRVNMKTECIEEIFYYKKSDIINFQIMQYRYVYASKDIIIPKYNYDALEEQFFQLSCTDDMYFLKRFFMEMQINFSSNFYMNINNIKFEDIFK